MKKKRYKIATLGCRTNQYESQAYRTQLDALGYAQEQANEPADLCIINTCASMHIVLQAGSNVVLKRMNRKYTRQMFYRTVEGLREISPDFTFTTDIIVGFPGESENDFQETLTVMKEVEFAKVHMFPYSARPRTRAATYTDSVPDQEIRRRKQELLHIAERQSYALRERFVGRRMTILTESVDEEYPEEICGHTQNFLMVRIPSEGREPNQIIEVLLTKNTPTGLIGKPISE